MLDLDRLNRSRRFLFRVGFTFHSVDLPLNFALEKLCGHDVQSTRTRTVQADWYAIFLCCLPVSRTHWGCASFRHARPPLFCDSKYGFGRCERMKDLIESLFATPLSSYSIILYTPINGVTPVTNRRRWTHWPRDGSGCSPVKEMGRHDC